MREQLDYIPAKEIGLREVLLTVGAYLREGRKFWYVLLAAGVLFGGYKYYRAKTTPVKYEATVGFMVNKEGGGGAAAFGGVLGQLGLGGGGGTGVNLQRVMTFATSRPLIIGVLLDSVSVEERPDLIINHLISYEELDEEWELEENFGVDRLSTYAEDSLSDAERAVLKMVYIEMLYGDHGIMATEIVEENGLMRIYVQTTNEDLSVYMVERVYQRLSDLYTLESTGQSLASVKLLQSKADSILAELTSAEYQLATLLDTRQSLTDQRDRVRQTQLGRRVSILSLAYTEVVRNLETAKFTLSTQTPFFQVLEAPFRPLRRFKPKALGEGLLGLGLGVFIAFALLSVRRLYLTVMRGDDPAAT